MLKRRFEHMYIYYAFKFVFPFLRSGAAARRALPQSAAMSSVTQYAIPLEFGGEWRTECLNTRFPLTILLCAGYSMKFLYMYYVILT